MSTLGTVKDSPIATDRLRGVPAIARFLGESERRTYYLLENSIIPAGKEGAIYVASKSALIADYNRRTGREG
jgi:hypothetical protein